jgi:hypothetical protein
MKAVHIAFCAVIMTGAWPARAAIDSNSINQQAIAAQTVFNPDAAPDFSSLAKVKLGDYADYVNAESKNSNVPDEQVYADAWRLSKALPRQDTIDIEPYKVKHDWLTREVKDPAHNPMSGSIISMESAYHGALLGAQEPPSPDVFNAFNEARDLRLKGKLQYDGYDGKRELPSNAAAACYYQPGKQADEIRVSLEMQMCGWMLGARVCGVVPYGHEGKHCYEADQKKLDPTQRKNGEVSAYQTEAEALRAITDPYELSRIIANYGPSAKKYNSNAAFIPPFITAFVKHIAELLESHEKGEIPDFVNKLGYQDDPDDSNLASNQPPDQSNQPDEPGPNPV